MIIILLAYGYGQIVSDIVYILHIVLIVLMPKLYSYVIGYVTHLFELSF